MLAAGSTPFIPWEPGLMPAVPTRNYIYLPQHWNVVSAWGGHLYQVPTAQMLSYTAGPFKNSHTSAHWACLRVPGNLFFSFLYLFLYLFVFGSMIMKQATWSLFIYQIYQMPSLPGHPSTRCRSLCVSRGRGEKSLWSLFQGTAYALFAWATT